MIFLKKKHLNNSVENKDSIAEQNNTNPYDQQGADSADVPDHNVSLSHVTLLNKLFHNPKVNLTEAPDTPYENEAWAPEAGHVGLFRKHRVNTEEYLNPSSEAQ